MIQIYFINGLENKYFIIIKISAYYDKRILEL